MGSTSKMKKIPKKEMDTWGSQTIINRLCFGVENKNVMQKNRSIQKPDKNSQT